MPAAQGLVGPQANSDGSSPIAGYRQGRQGDIIVSELHGRFYEQNLRGNLYSIGCQLTALSAATILLTASAQPILGVWNPPTSGVNLVLVESALVTQLNNATSVAPGAFVWASSVGNSALSAGLTPFNRKTLSNSGSQAKAFSLSTASLLTGLTNNLAIFGTSEFNVASSLATTAVPATTPVPSVSGLYFFDGLLIVPPGGVLALLNTVSSVTHSVAGRLVWEEVPA